MSTPDISVVMSVFNGAESIVETVRSVLQQDSVDIEFIIVNDGSSDNSLRILELLSSEDPRIILLDQTNRGLTQSLIAACNKAQGRFIARQDNGDTSLENRLKIQYDYLNGNPKCSMLSCATRFVSPNDEELYCVIQTQLEAKDGLRKSTVGEFSGPPHHGSVMFSNDGYQQVGGYRGEFLVAQDIDLWSRLVEIGEHHSIQQVLYKAVVEKNSISMLRRRMQMEATQTVIDCAQARSLTGNDEAILNAYGSISRPVQKPQPSQQSNSAYYYFLGANLASTNIKASSKYFRLATEHYPLNWKAWIKRAINYAKSIAIDILKK